MLDGEDFAAVLLAAQEGDELAFATLYDAFNARLVRYFSARAPREAEDLAAETWLQVATGVGRFRGGEPEFRSFLFTIAHRRIVDLWRRPRRDEPTDPADLSMHPSSAAHGGSAADDCDDPAALVVSTLTARAAVERITSLLSRDQADVVLLRLLAGLDVDEVAAILDKKPGTVRVLQHRALARLARSFSLEGVTR